jgi:hypothetical protein
MREYAADTRSLTFEHFVEEIEQNTTIAKAKAPEGDRAHQFLTTMLPNLSGSLLAKQYTNVRELLDDARTVEGRRKDIHYNHQRTPCPHHPTMKLSTTTDQRWNAPNASFGPVAKRPEGWLGVITK